MNVARLRALILLAVVDGMTADLDASGENDGPVSAGDARRKADAIVDKIIELHHSTNR